MKIEKTYKLIKRQTGYTVSLPNSLGRTLQEKFGVERMKLEIFEDHLKYTPIYPEKVVN